MPMQPDPNAAPPPDQGGGENPAQAMTSLLDAMKALHDGIADKAPPEALQALEAAMSAYEQFLSALGGGGQSGPQPVQQGSDMAGGRA